MSEAAAPRPVYATFGSVLAHPWVRFLARRLLRFAVSMWALLTFAFAMIHLTPGDPVRAALGTTAPAQLVAARRETLGLNDPLPVQYWHFISDLFTGNLGTSFQTRLPVAQVIAERLPETLELAVLAFLLTLVIAVPLGLAMAVITQGARRRRAELGFTSAAVVVSAIPDFLLAVLLVYVFGVSLGWLPIAGESGPSSYVLPVLALGLGPASAIARIVRVETLAVLDQDYIRTARAKRLRARLVYVRHALPNALTASLTLAGLLLSALVAGTVLVENVFAWPGLGQTIVTSILQRDYPMVQGLVLVYGALVLLVNLGVDILLAVLDPRSTIRET